MDLTKDLIYALTVLGRLPAADILIPNDFWLPALAGSLRAAAGLVVVSANRYPKHQYALYGRAARVVVPSRVIAKAIIRQTPSMASRIIRIPNPFDTTLFVPPPDGREGKTARQIVYVGRVHPEKAVDVLVRAFGRVAESRRDLHLDVVGPTAIDQGGGGEAYLRELRALAQGLSVTFRGPEFDVGRLAMVYQDADLFCYPSVAERGEALPVAPLEAMCTALPVVVSRLECFDDVIEDGKTGLVFDHRSSDPAGALASKLQEALADWPRMQEMGKRARLVAQQFGFTRVADAFLDDFHQLLERRLGVRS